ncbi:4-hydroxyphenylpyruvate dioxygenase [Streptomyces kaniharaensis]|uniref:4-hydroxyphenylpyruvate dioxygenase n=1 Tax=Streptomyces kaniharaensis TaxID=212423 RepID=A0A6N7L0H3_9ACTN|nr:4-hydroxyphenylpyruvate dioxygenase [Streptomyces kaniharaensis]MQS16625.1 4-hydroxyphenylpyruvate dioxygenase [Streptomyces kaniharaensis]
MTITEDFERHDQPQHDAALPVDDLRLDHVELYVEDLDREAAEWTSRYGFAVVGTAGGPEEGFRSLALRQGRILLVLTEGTDDEHPATIYVHLHGSGVARIALSTGDVEAAFAHAVDRGARPLATPARTPGTGVVAAEVSGFGDVVHTLVERDGTDGLPAGFRHVEADASAQTPAADAPGLVEIDHFAVCVNVGELEEMVAFYQQSFGFREIFEERIAVGSQAMLSKVVQSRGGDITFTVIQPDPDADPGQIDDFLKNHGGSGVQHIAFSSEDAVGSVRALARGGVEFLSTPATYYELLGRRVELRRHGLEALRELNLLVDEDHGGQLFQIFTRSTHPRRTLFFEVIERLGAETFGSSNIKALYEAVELEQLRQNGPAR